MFSKEKDVDFDNIQVDVQMKKRVGVVHVNEQMHHFLQELKKIHKTTYQQIIEKIWTWYLQKI